MSTPHGAAGPMKKIQKLGMFIGIALLLFIWFVDVTPGLSEKGRHLLAMVICTVIWWGTKPVIPPFTGLMFMTGIIFFDLAPIHGVTNLTSGINFFLYFSAFVLADVVETSGLAKRVAYIFASRYIKSFTGMIVSAFVLTFILGFLIPHPFPRAFLLLAIFKSICSACNMNAKDSSIVALAIFASSCPISMMTLTGDAGLNVVLAGMSGLKVSWMAWTSKMFLPGMLASIITLGIFLFMFRSSEKIVVETSVVKKNLAELGPMTKDEKVTLFWMAVAVVMWATETIHHLSTGVVSIVIVCAMAMPYIGGVCKPPNWKAVDFGSLIFIMSAMALGPSGAATGMNVWLAKTLFPTNVPGDIYSLAILIGAVTMATHMVLGSAVSTASVIVAMVLTYTKDMGIDPLIPVLFAYTAVYMHYIFSFQTMNIMIGVDKGGYTDKDVVKLGIPLTAAVFIVLLFEAFLWSL
jgi:di/tricarboxylate transporter